MAKEKNEEVKWKFETQDKIYSTPLVSDGIIYIGSEDNHLYAIDLITGKENWHFKTTNSVYSPALYKGIIYFGTEDNHIYGVDIKTGEEKWKYEIENYPPWKDAINRAVSNVVVSAGMVYFGCDDNHFYALDAKTGKEKWKFKTGGRVSSPAVVGGVVYFGSIDDYLYALDSQNGKEKWKFKTESNVCVWSSPAVLNSMVYFGSDDNHLYAVDIKTGKEKWKFKAGDYIWSTPTISEGVVCFGCNDKYLYALDIKSGELKWKIMTGGSVGSQAVLDSVVYFIHSKYEFPPVLNAVDIKTGKLKWKFETDTYKKRQSVSDPWYDSSPHRSMPVISDGTVYFNFYENYYYSVKRGYLCAVDIELAENFSPERKAEEQKQIRLEQKRQEGLQKIEIIMRGTGTEFIQGTISNEIYNNLKDKAEQEGKSFKDVWLNETNPSGGGDLDLDDYWNYNDIGGAFGLIMDQCEVEITVDGEKIISSKISDLLSDAGFNRNDEIYDEMWDNLLLNQRNGRYCNEDDDYEKGLLTARTLENTEIETVFEINNEWDWNKLQFKIFQPDEIGIGTPYDDLILGINYDGEDYESDVESEQIDIMIDHQLLTSFPVVE